MLSNLMQDYAGFATHARAAGISCRARGLSMMIGCGKGEGDDL